MTRGESNKNPGNIRWGDPWQGLVPFSERTDPEFCQFIDVTWGIRAIAKILHSYAVEGVKTLRETINHWAPPVENDTDSYVNDVSTRSGIDPDIQIDLSDYSVCMPTTVAIIWHENGEMIYEQTTIDKGLSLAGVVP